MKKKKAGEEKNLIPGQGRRPRGHSPGLPFIFIIFVILQIEPDSESCAYGLLASLGEIGVFYLIIMNAFITIFKIVACALSEVGEKLGKKDIMRNVFSVHRGYFHT